MNKNDLVQRIAKAAKISKQQAAAALESILDGITLALTKGDGTINLPPLGKFVVKERQSKFAKKLNGRLIKLPKRKIVQFLPGLFWKEAAKKTAVSKVSSKASPKKRIQRDYDLIRIFYVTDREKIRKSHGRYKYGPGRSHNGSLDFGECEVSIPIDRRMGSLSGASLKKYLSLNAPKYWVILKSILPKSSKTFEEALRRKVAASEERDAFVFIHGYNLSFEDAACRTAQLAYDLQFKGAPILYSWPSQGKQHLYTVDETNIEWTTTHLKEFLDKVSSDSGAAKVHVIAHSMGNRALVHALKTISIERGNLAAALFRQVVLTAPA